MTPQTSPRSSVAVKMSAVFACCAKKRDLLDLLGVLLEPHLVQIDILAHPHPQVPHPSVIRRVSFPDDQSPISFVYGKEWEAYRDQLSFEPWTS
jgi:hypothetical protein